MQADHLRLVVDNSGRIGIREKVVCRDLATGHLRNLGEVLGARHPLPRLPKANGLCRHADLFGERHPVTIRQGEKVLQGHGRMIQHSVVSVNNKRLRDASAPLALTVPVMSESDSTKREFAKRLASARLLAGFRTQAAFAKHLGVEAETYRRWERAETEPNLSMLVRLSDALDISLEILVRGTPRRDGERRTA